MGRCGEIVGLELDLVRARDSVVAQVLVQLLQPCEGLRVHLHVHARVELGVVGRQVAHAELAAAVLDHDVEARALLEQVHRDLPRLQEGSKKGPERV